MNIIGILRDWLKAHGYDGLCDAETECGCNLDDFAPCECPKRCCEPGYKIPAEHEEFDFFIVREKPVTEEDK